MTIDHLTTHGPHANGELAADWMLESGHSGRSIGPREVVADTIRLSIPGSDQTLTLGSAAALKDALVVHLRNMGWDDPDTQPDTPPAPRDTGWQTSPEALADLRAKLSGKGEPDALEVDAPGPGALEVAVAIQDAYAENSRTIGARDARGFTLEEAAEILRGLKSHGILYRSEEGILYTRAALDALREVAAGDLSSPVVRTIGDVRSKTVRAWSDEQARGAWNHAMEDTPRPGLLTDRPSGRAYTALASSVLRDRLNEINGADAPRV